MTEMFIHPLWDWRSAIASPYGPENPVTRHVLLTIALHMSPAGDSAFPTAERLVAETGLSRSTVLAHTSLAEKTGWLGKRQRPGRGSRGWRRIEYLPLVPPGLEEKARAWREESRRLWKASQEGGPVPGPAQDSPRGGPRHPVDKSRDGGPAGARGGPAGGNKVVREVHPKVSSSNTPSKAAAAMREKRPPHPVDNSKPAAAAAGLIYPPNLSSAQQESMRRYLTQLSPGTAQTLLDELAGLMASGMGGKSVRDPIAVFAVLARQHDDGTFVPSHAHRIQVEREGSRP